MKNREEIIINWKPDRAHKEPIFRQIVQYFSKKIANGDWTVGSVLPSQRMLARQFGVNRSTIVTALDELISYGMVKSEPSKKMVVAGNTWSRLLSNAPPDWGHYLQTGSFHENVPTIQTINKLEFVEKTIRLGTGELAPELMPQDLMRAVYQRLEQRMPSLNYLEPLGLLELREMLSKRLERVGIKAPPSTILITSGSLQAMQLISVGILNKGAVVYTEAPSYIQSLQVFQSAGVRLQGIPMDKEGIAFWHLPDRKKWPEDALLYTIPNFNNPTGILMSQDRRQRLFQFSSDNRLPVIEDDAYGELWLEEEPPLSLKSLDQSGMVLYLGTISKALAPGLRVGWLVGPESVVNRLGDVKMQVDYGASSVSQWMVAELLKSGLYESYLSQLREALRRRRDYTLALLEKYFTGLVTWHKPKGGFYIWLQFGKEVMVHKLFHQLLKHNILINPGHVYDLGAKHAIRLSYAYASEEDIEKGLGILAKTVLH